MRRMSHVKNIVLRIVFRRAVPGLDLTSRLLAGFAHQTAVLVGLPSSNSEESRHPDLPAFRSSIARPTNTPIYASSDTSRCPQQDSRSGWIRYFLSCRALASSTTCRFIPALSGLPAVLGGIGLCASH